MAITKGAMTSLPTSQTLFLQTVEEPEDNRINFRDSLKFFQEQLVINGANFPSPGPVPRSGNNTLKKNRFRSYKEQNSDTDEKILKDNYACESDIQSIKSCKIDIPTVDTILESVRVLRAIQKSQEERGSNWNLDVTEKSHIEFNYTDDWVNTTDIKQNEYFDKERNDEISSTNYSMTVDTQTVIEINQNVNSENETNIERNDETPSKTDEEKETVTDIKQHGYSDKESNNERNCETINSVNSQGVADINRNGYSDKKSNDEKINEIPSNNSAENQTVTGLHQNGYSDTEPVKEGHDETSSEKFSEKQIVTDSDKNKYSDKECNNQRNDETPLTDSVDKQATETKVDTQVNGTNQENLKNGELQFNAHNSNGVNEICSFWPSNIVQKGNNWNEEKKHDSLFPATGDETKNTESKLFNLNEKNSNKRLNETDSFQLNDNSLDIEYSDKETEQIQQSNVCNNNILQDMNISENSNHFQNSQEIIKNTNTQDSLHVVCTDLLNRLNEKIPNIEGTSKELLLKGSDTTTEILKIETYEDPQKHDHFLLNESLWKKSCSPNDSTSTKIEHNDSDSGIGTQRSASSLSPNHPNQMQKDSWSDTCSSHYASAECSPYHSLNSVFDYSFGLNTTLGETREIESPEILTRLTGSEWQDALEKTQENVNESSEKDHISLPQENCDKRKDPTFKKHLTDSPIQVSELESHSAELDAEISYCNFITNYTIENPCKRIGNFSEEVEPTSEICDNKEPNTANDQKTNTNEQTIDSGKDVYEHTIDSEKRDHEQNNDKGKEIHEQTIDTEREGHEQIIDTEAREQTFALDKADSLILLDSLKENALEDVSCDLGRVQKFTSASCDLISIVESLYTIKENPVYQVLPAADASEEKFEETLFILSKGAFCEHPPENYLVIIEDSILHITKNSQVLLSLNMKYGDISADRNTLKIDNRMGRCVYVRCDISYVQPLKAKIELHCLKHWKTDCLQLVHYPLKCHQNVVIIDIGSCSTRAGILMDQPTLPTLFFPTICAIDKRTGTCVYGMEALQPEVRQHSNLSFPVRPTIKITKHTIDINLMEGLFRKIFSNLKVDPTQYTVQVCLPRNLSINAQTALVKLLLEGLKTKAVSLTNQALLTLYAHDISTAIVVDIGDRTDVLPVVDGFIVENGVTKLPHGGQRLIHHMKHGLAEKRISLSNDIDSFIVQYITENLAYVAEDYDDETRISLQYPDIVMKTITLQPASSECLQCKSITLEEARFKIPEGLFNPEMWGLDSPGIHHLVQKAIQATSIDARKRIAENIYVSGGVTMLPGFVERLKKEVAKLSKAKIVPKVYASNYRYHCTYIGACKFAKMEVFPQVCITLQEYTKNSTLALKKCALYY